MQQPAVVQYHPTLLGFLPGHSPFLRTRNVPKAASLTVSLRTMQSEISFKTDSVKAADSVRDKPAFRNTRTNSTLGS
jgi:hypothetical protein